MTLMTVQDVFIFITHFYVFVPGKLHIPGGSVYGRPDFCGNLYHACQYHDSFFRKTQR